MVMDKGLQFTYHFFTSSLEMLGISLHHTMSYHPKGNRMVDLVRRSLENSLFAQGGEWKQELPWVLLEIRNAPLLNC